MTNSSDRQGSFDQGTQDDYFNADLAAAHHHQDKSAATEKFRNQGQQDDYFNADLAIAANHPPDRAVTDQPEAEQYVDQGQQTDEFDTDLAASNPQQQQD